MHGSHLTPAEGSLSYSPGAHDRHVEDESAHEEHVGPHGRHSVLMSGLESKYPKAHNVQAVGSTAHAAHSTEQGRHVTDTPRGLGL